MHSDETVAIIDRYEYHWCDGVKYKKPTKLPASQYISLLMDWVEQQINNEELFPVTVGQLLILQQSRRMKYSIPDFEWLLLNLRLQD